MRTVPSVPSPPGPVVSRRRSARAWTRWSWLLGLALGAVVVGPGLCGASLLNLDLVLLPDAVVPPGLFGLGPGLTQRVPLFGLLAAAGAVVGGAAAGKAFLVGTVAAGFVGAGRLVRPAGGKLPSVAAGLLWAAGPFALTRIGAGHLNLAWVVATLPWAVPLFARPSADLRRTFLAALLLAVGGPAAGAIGLTAIGVSLVVESGGRRPVRTLLVAAAANAVWAAPTAVVLWAGAGVAGSGDFATTATSPAGWIAVVVGNGFWSPAQQAGGVGAVGAVAAVGLSALALLGRRDLDPAWRRSATAGAGVGLLLAVASAVPGLRAAYAAASALPVGAPLRESHRFLALWLVWSAPASALGGSRAASALAARARDQAGPTRWASPTLVSGAAAAVACLPLVAALAVSVPGWWGIQGRLEPVSVPHGWLRARTEIQAGPGPVLVLPWNEYPTLAFAGGRTVFNPLPDLLGGDVISSYDPGFEPGGGHQEQIDRRARVIDDLERRFPAATPAASPTLARLGVRWVLLARGGDPVRAAALDHDPGLRVVLRDPAVVLYAVRAPRHPVPARPLPPLVRTEAGRGAVLAMAGAPGWVQGWGSPAEVTPDGLLRLTGHGRVVWFAPAVGLAAVDVAVVAAAVCCWRSRRRRPVRNVGSHGDYLLDAPRH